MKTQMPIVKHFILFSSVSIDRRFSVTSVGGTTNIPEVAVSRFFSGGGFSDYVRARLFFFFTTTILISPPLDSSIALNIKMQLSKNTSLHFLWERTKASTIRKSDVLRFIFRL
jgi:hypothetical protein